MKYAAKNCLHHLERYQLLHQSYKMTKMQFDRHCFEKALRGSASLHKQIYITLLVNLNCLICYK